MKVILTFFSGEVREFHTSKKTFTIGRSAKADIAVEVDGISRHHCQIEVSESGEIFVTDLASTNGVLVDGKKIPPHQRVEYNSFLNFSMGPIQTIHLEPTELTPSASTWPNKSQSPNIIQKTKTNTRIEKSFTPLKKPASNTKANLNLIAMLLLSLLLLALVFFLYHSEEEETLPLPTQKIQF